jgi:hypothetical protein
MARLNIETDIFSDMRFLDLIILVGDREKAIGKLICFWIVAQKYWVNDRSLVPLEVFERMNLEQLISVGLAEKRDNGIYAKGSEERFDWLLIRKEAAKRGGNKSAELRASKIQANASKSNPLTLTLTPSLTLSEKKEETKKENSFPKQPKKVATEGSEVWSAYSLAYRLRYGIEPKRNATTSAQCSQLVKRLGVKDAIEVVRFYLSHGKSWYVQNSHAIGNCLKDAEALYTQMRTNVRVTASQANEIDRGVTQAEMFERVTRELEEKYEGKKL